MELYVDDCRTDPGVGPSAPLSDVVDAVKERSVERRRLIVSIACDGMDVTGQGFADKLAQPAEGYGRIDMHTAEPEALVQEALVTAGRLLDASEQAIAQVVEMLAQGKAGVALPRLAECCQAWLQVHEGICNAIAVLDIDPEGLELDGRALPELMAEPLERLQQLKETVEAQDHVLLGDILTYEFPGAISSWRTLIDAVAARVPAATK